MLAEALSNVVNGTSFDSIFQGIDPGLYNTIAISLGVAGAVYLAQAHFHEKSNLPPLVPYTNPIKGSTEEYQADPSGWVKKQKAKYGPVFRAHLNGRIITVVGKDLVRDVALRPDMKQLLESFRNLTLDTADLLKGNPWLKYFPTLNKYWAKMHYKFTTPVRKHRALLKSEVGPVVERRVRECKSPGWKRPDDMLQTLIEMYPADQINIDEIVLILITLIFASVHTTSMNSNFALYFIAAYPGYVEELLEEQDKVFQELGITDTSDPVATWTFEVVKRLEKLDSFVRESFRYRDDHLALPHRQVEFKDITLSNGMLIPKGQHISLDHEEVYRSEEWQGPNPDKFDPWRFVGKNKQATKIGADYLPFGIGRFACPGRFFAIQEIKTVLSILIRNYHISMVDKFQIIHVGNSIRLPYGRVKFERRQS
ncbi:cytochrome P450 [Basidiobolus meristosporus CBS 931.73]|uniref:Cytochrome P450 n=1 Tax=Basidiobolus meristosporus CBS 931.73 TaxID=1314790 RepID=A0A1Y1X074_9FUNG|nr:cytochrome P450 [Basidiobolus meristosporus CBS 931.73]ORX93832.1 cytochrome P450 [Basidiobolus meristosporus CBS 931.73]|eukprot:ORX79133.1 cytochrome P450 [Basidiobolus meristosporus CBS 931.73]